MALGWNIDFSSNSVLLHYANTATTDISDIRINLNKNILQVEPVNKDVSYLAEIRSIIDTSLYDWLKNILSQFLARDSRSR